MLCIQERRKLGPAVATAGCFRFSHLALLFVKRIHCSELPALGGAVLSHLILSEPREPVLPAAEGLGMTTPLAVSSPLFLQDPFCQGVCLNLLLSSHDLLV